MRIIAKKTLKDYWTKHANCRKELEEWYGVTCKSGWKTPNDIKQTYPKASIVGGNRVVFNIVVFNIVGGNYRLVVKFAYKTQIGFIKFIGTHSEYDRIDVETI
jgi:mRNA interferase HigB